jgi:hypothetical protein
MLTVSQIFLLFVGCHSITADVSADNGGVPTLTEDFSDVGLQYEQSRFIPLSIHAPEKLVHHNGSRERAQGYCYGIPSWGSQFCLSLLLTLLKLKSQVTPVTAQYAVTTAAVLARARSAVEAVSVMRVMDAVKAYAVSPIVIPVAQTAVSVQRGKDALVTTTQIGSFAVLQAVKQNLLPRQLHMNLLPHL